MQKRDKKMILLPIGFGLLSILVVLFNFFPNAFEIMNHSPLEILGIETQKERKIKEEKTKVLNAISFADAKAKKYGWTEEERDTYYHQLLHQWNVEHDHLIHSIEDLVAAGFWHFVWLRVV